jgi:hypothetical protein
VPDHKRFWVDLRFLITEIRISPWASEETFPAAQRLKHEHEYTVPVHWSALARFKNLIATEHDLIDDPASVSRNVKFCFPVTCGCGETFPAYVPRVHKPNVCMALGALSVLGQLRAGATTAGSLL